MSTFNQKWNKRVYYRIEAWDKKLKRWYEICPRQPTIEDAAIKKFRYERRGFTIRVVEQKI